MSTVEKADAKIDNLKQNKDGYVYPIQTDHKLSYDAGRDQGVGIYYHDIIVPQNTELYAITDGTVKYVTRTQNVDGTEYYRSYGFVAYFTSSDKTIEIMYAHMESAPGIAIPDLDKMPGSSNTSSTIVGTAEVTKGDVIGYSGNRGNTSGIKQDTGYHLHIEVKVNGKRVEPTTLFPDLKP